MIKIFYDLETTGFDYRKHSIHQLAGIIEVDLKPVEEFNINIRPHPKAKIEKEALDVCGVYEEDLMLYDSMEDQFKVFKSMLKRYIDPYNTKQKAYLVGYNNRSFDDKFLRKYFELMGDNFFNSWFWSDTHDAMDFASAYLEDVRPQMSNFKLGRVGKEMGFEVEDDCLHDALYDVRLTRKIYLKARGL